ncbi:uncharacterized protein LOC129595638 [Paramacrobiotus metropolitanus]|uniref:uncharacterized protein LOC129595638 n=1 Tax=Paramacrobiotus metropolitanus TaxID=2943436 RepID=UPI0024457A99|nr:uncharacterized protein LOC129595638 [Paramacrobiotus metropolitanus]
MSTKIVTRTARRVVTRGARRLGIRALEAYDRAQQECQNMLAAMMVYVETMEDMDEVRRENDKWAEEERQEEHIREILRMFETDEESQRWIRTANLCVNFRGRLMKKEPEEPWSSPAAFDIKGYEEWFSECMGDVREPTPLPEPEEPVAEMQILEREPSPEIPFVQIVRLDNTGNVQENVQPQYVSIVSLHNYPRSPWILDLLLANPMDFRMPTTLGSTH